MTSVKWIKQITRNLTLHKLDVYFRGLMYALKKHFNLDYNNLLIYAKGYKCEVYIGEKNLNAFAELIKNYFIDHIRLNNDPFEFLYKIQNDLVKKSIEIGKKNISSKEELLQEFREFMEKFYDYQIMIWFPVICEDGLYHYAEQRLIELTKDEKSWDIITEPYEPSVIQKEFIDLLKVAVNYSEEKLQAHQKKYEWMSMRFVEDNPYNLEHFRKRLEEIKNPKSELKRIKKDLKNKRLRFFKLLNSLDLSREDRELFIAVNKLNHLRNTRDNGRRVAYYHIKPLYNKILEFLGCNYDTFLSYINEDIIKALESGVKLEKNKAANKYIYMFKEGKFEFASENPEKRLEEEGIKSPYIGEVSEIKGSIANMGKVTGKVKIITLNSWAKDVADVARGDVLVAVSTKPDYIVAMEKAAAFVTDEGGITCHAAIVSREMNKPCIVGTSIATSVLRDGDLVEVDADKGIIKKL